MPDIDISLPHKFRGLLTPARWYVYYGGRGSAKSWSIGIFLICAAMDKKLKILCARELQISISESVHSLLKTIISKFGLDEYFKVKINYIECVNGSLFLFKGLAHNVESVKSTEGIDIVWIEEADKVSQASWDILTPTVRKPGSRIMATFNPCHDDDPIYVMHVLNKQPESVVEYVSWRDNKYFPDVLKNEMLHLKATDYEKYMHVWEGELRTISDAQIFKNKFVVEDFSSDGVENFKTGMDFGFANDPSATIRCFIQGEDLFIDREGYGHHIEIPELGNLLSRTLPNRHYKVKADCARPETISYLKGQGWNIEAAKKWQGSVEDGIEYIKSFRRVVIHPRCVNTIKEFTRYSYKVDRHTNEILPIPVDAHNHLIDALRYALDDLIKGKVTIYTPGVIM
jgi:phage terminase large subunit